MLKSYDVNKDIRSYLAFAILLVAVMLTCIIVNFILKHILIRIISRLILRNKYQWDDVLVERRVLYRLANIAPGIIIFLYSPAFEDVAYIAQRIAAVYILLMLYFLVNSALDAVNDVYITHPISKVRPMKGLLQVFKIVFYAIISIVLLGTLMNQNPLLLLSGIGALAAVFSFVFKDSILGFIAGLQLTSNDMLRIGDWIEMTKYGADGDVIDITLNTVKVQNFDKTIVTIPAYALVSDSFRNWRGMVEFGGRRIKRSVFIDMNSITFCTSEMLEKYKKINYLRDYITEKQEEIKEYNQYGGEEGSLANGRHLTNVGVFRMYIQYFLNDNPYLNENVSPMVRQLPPGENGLPLEVYAFTKTITWTEYETIQSDIFDHIFSVAGEFGIRIFQNPTGYDMRHQLWARREADDGDKAFDA
ncbi:MAG TPA: mechanosensitive ion channel [Clostridiales bacterium]|nr:mechanosensitive ion channel [Clostridiales bacterium]